MSKKQDTTRVISFRVPTDEADQIDVAASQVKKERASFIKDLFMPAFKRHIKRNGQEPLANIGLPVPTAEATKVCKQ